MRKRILEALRALPCENVNNDAFFLIGRALKKEGLPCSVWEEWSRDDERAKPGLCEGYWEVMDPGPEGEAEILRMARLLGRLPPEDEDAYFAEQEASAQGEGESQTETGGEDKAALSGKEEDDDPTEFDGLPRTVSLESFRETPPRRPAPLIEGVLRRGHKLLLSGSSKAGKSFLLMELCVAIAEGTPWLGFQVQKGRVLYVNLEIDPASAIHRFLAIYKALGLEPRHMADVELWNLRGQSLPMDQLTWPLIRRVKENRFDAVVIDPIYKVLTGDENSAGDMAAFCNRLDRVCAKTGCSVIYCHHHSKGAQAGKKTIDRASGSGVFARDADALLDIIEVELTEHQQKAHRGATAWRMESSLREFPNVEPVYFWYQYPLHRRDAAGVLSGAPAAPDSLPANVHEGDPSVFPAARGASPAQRRDRLNAAFTLCQQNGRTHVEDLAAAAKVSQRTLRDWLKENKAGYQCVGGIVERR